MSKNYKDAMDKIIASDELKSRVLAAAAEKIADGEKSQAKRVRKIYIKRAISYAACFVVCVTSVMLYKNFRTDKIPVPPVPANTQVPVTPDVTAAPAIPNAENESADAPNEHGGNSQKTAAPSEKRTGTPKKTPAPTAVPSDNPGKNEPPAVSAPAADDRNDTPDVKSDTPAAAPSGGVESDLPSDGLCGGSPFADANSLGELYANAGYAFKMPYLLPDGYRLSGCTLIGGTLVQITYENDADTILYRTEKSAQDISGDYNSYPDTVTIDISGITAAARGFSGKYYSIIWHEGESSYSLGSTEGLSEEEMENIISGIDFYKKGE